MSTFTIAAVEAVPPAGLRLTLATGKTLQLDVSGYLGAPGYEELTDPAAFADVAVEPWGHGIEWPALDQGIPAATLYRLAREQAGTAFPVSEFNAWMQRHGLSLAAAAKALGLSRRSVIYYHCGQRPIPPYIGLACRGWEALQAERNAA